MWVFLWHIFPGRILEWLAISFSKESSWPRDWTHVFCISRQILCHGATREAQTLLLWGMGWGGRLEGASEWRTHVHPWLIHVNVWQKPLQYCKVISLQFKKILKILPKYLFVANVMSFWFISFVCALAFFCFRKFSVPFVFLLYSHNKLLGGYLRIKQSLIPSWVSYSLTQFWRCYLEIVSDPTG